MKIKIRSTNNILKKLGKKTLVALATFILVILPVTLLILFNSPKGVEAAWADEEWGYRKSIAITAHTSSENNVYISTTISNTNTLVTNGQLQSDCGDLRFTKQNGEVLPYYISSGCNSASTVVQVFFNTFPAGAQTIYFYYGNPSAVNGFKSTAFSTEATSYTIGSTGSEEKAPSPVAYWKFDDGTGTTAQDSTTNNNDGTLTNGPTWQTEDMCVSGKCLKFDGTDDYVSTVDNPLDMTGDMVVSAWVRAPTTGAVQLVMSKYDSNADRGWLLLLNAAGKASFDGRTGTGTYYTSGLSTTTVGDNKWHFIVGKRSGSTFYIYVDGNLENSTSNNSGSFANTKTMDIGRNTDFTGSAYYTGFIDEPKIYNYARSSAQILADFNSRSSSEGLSANIGNSDQGKSLSNGLVGYWKMDESSWTNNCTATSVTDSSGNGNNGKACPATTGPTGGAAGKFGNGGSFDGSDDYVDVADASSLDVTQLTLSAWINATALGGRVIDKITAGGSDGYLMDTSGNKIRICANACVSSTTTLSTGSWQHIVITFDGTTTRFYLNGAADGNSTNITAISTNALTLRIGANSLGTEVFNGKIDEARVYNRALSPAEVTQLYNFAPGPVAYYNFEENTGTTVNDRSGNANTGTWNGSGIDQWKPGKNGSAGNFDGSSDYVDMGDVSSVENRSTLTVSVWVKPDNNTDQFAFPVAKGSSGTSRWFMSTDTNSRNGTDEVGIGVGNGENSFGYTNGNLLVGGQWGHWTMVFDGTQTGNSNRLKFYFNGVEQTLTFSGTIPSSIPNITDSLKVGWDGTTPISGVARYLKGKIDDVKIYNYARTQQQIVEDMLGGGSSVSSWSGAIGSNSSKPAAPVGYWKFDEGYSTTANNVGNGGTALNGTLTNMSSPATSTSGWTQAGKVGKALVFDGSNDYVNIPDNAAVDMTTGLTISVWIKHTSGTSSTDEQLIAKYNATGTDDGAYAIDYRTNESLRFYFGNTAGNSYSGAIETGPSVIVDTAWHHVVGTYDAGTAKIYIDGKAVATTTDGTIPTTLRQNSLDVKVGARLASGNPGLFFNGSIDEVKVYNFALTADQVKMDMNQGAAAVYGNLGNASTSSANSAAQEYCVPGDTATCSAPVGRWDFEEGTGTTVNDSSGSNLTGTWNGSGTRWANGKYGKTGKFNGTDDYVTMGDTSIVDFGTGNFTLEAWVKLGSLTQGRGMIIAKDNSGASGRQFALEWDGNDNNSNFIRIGYFYSDPGQVWLDTANNIINDTNWHHISAGRSGNSLFVYIDGILKASGTTGGSHASMQATASQLRVGNRQYSGATDELNGSIDQVRIYNYARSSSQIKWSYNKGAPVTHWKLDECQGTTINDASGTVNGTWSGSGGSQTSAGTCQTASTAWGNGVTGKRNYSLNFDGTDDRVSFTVPSVFNLASGGSMSLSAWIKTSTDGRGILQLQNGNPLIYLQTGNTTSGGTANKFVAYIRDDSGTIQAIPINGVTTVTDNNWHHVAFVIDNTNLYLYVDGRRETSTTWAGGAVTVGGSTGYLGDLNNATNWEFSGQIDDFRVYNYALSATQIKNLYNDGTANYGPTTGAP